MSRSFHHLVNWQSFINRGLVSWWMLPPYGLWGNALTLRDLTRRSDMVWQSATLPPRLGPQGRPGGFGSTDFINQTDRFYQATAPNGLPIGSSARTIAMWFNSDSTSSSFDHSLFSYGSGSNGQQIVIYYEDNGISLATFGHREIIAKGLLSLGTWYHLAITFPEGSTATADALFYLNGIPQTPATEAGSSQTLNTASSVVKIGDSVTGAQRFDGRLDDVRIWNRALSDAEIRAMYIDSCLGYRKTLNWRRDEAFKAPAVGGAITVNPAPVSLSLSAVAPTVAISASPSPVGLALSTVAPTAEITAKPSPTSLSLSVVQPNAAIVVKPDPVALSLSVPTPTVSGTVSVSPSPVGLALSVPSPTIAITAKPSPVSLPLTVVEPTASITAKPDPVAVAFSVVSPLIEKALSPSPVGLSLGVVAPTFSGGAVDVPYQENVWVANARGSSWIANKRPTVWTANERGNAWNSDAR